MIETIFENDFVIISQSSHNSILVIKWKGKCGNIIDQAHTALFEDIRNLIKNIAPVKLLADMSECDYHLTPDTGTWYENPMFAMYGELPPRQIAIILPQNLFVNAFFDAYRAHEVADTNVKIQYFEAAEKAWNWLNSEF
jgi:hypothetical protein